MSNNNGNDGGAAMGLALVGAFCMFVMIFIYAVACFVAVVFTIISWLAWDKPLRVFGYQLCAPHEARYFVYTGLAGAVGLAAFVVFCSLLFDKPVPDEWWFYIFTGGYSLAPWVVAGFLPKDFFDGFDVGPHPTVIDHVPAPAPSLPPAPQPFAYASWDDEKPGGDQP